MGTHGFLAAEQNGLGTPGVITRESMCASTLCCSLVRLVSQ